MQYWSVALLILLSIFNVVYSQNGDCALIVPPNPLTAVGLSSPYYLTNAPNTNGPCNMANSNQESFVQGAILNTDTGAITIYNPLVIDLGQTPPIAPSTPTLPTNNVVALWFGTNANTLTLLSTPGNNSLQQGNCVNGGGVDKSIFGQFAYCNAQRFFRQANIAIFAGKLVVPPVGFAADGLPCPTTRDYFVVDQDPSDNVVTSYLLITTTGATVQDTPSNRAKLTQRGIAFTVIGNGSDNRLLDVFLLPALGCSAYNATDAAAAAQSQVATQQQKLSALALNELRANTWQLNPTALVPAFDEMVEVFGNGTTSVSKINSYRTGVNQPLITRIVDASPIRFCAGLLAIQPHRLFVNQAALSTFVTASGIVTPDPAVGNNLYTFMVGRLLNTLSMSSAQCTQLFNLDPATQLPFNITLDNNGAIISATYNPQAYRGFLNYLSNTATSIRDAQTLKTLNANQLNNVTFSLSQFGGGFGSGFGFEAFQFGFQNNFLNPTVTVPLADGSAFVNIYF